jgi:hypothetical protein
MRSRFNTANRINTRSRINTPNRINTRSRVNTANRVNTRSRINTANRVNMPSRIADTRRIGCGAGSGIVNIPKRFTIRGPITIRTTGTLSGITAVVDTPSVEIAALVHTPSVQFAAVLVADTPPAQFAAVVVADTPAVVAPVAVAVAMRNGDTVRLWDHYKSLRNSVLSTLPVLFFGSAST